MENLPKYKSVGSAANLYQHDGCHVLQFRQDVRTGAFPAKEHTYGMIEGELGKLKSMRRKIAEEEKIAEM
jgi:hypothetical protein